MKKKLVIVSALIVILAMLAIGGSLAWFTDEDAATNVFTVGSVEIEQLEQQRGEDAEGNDILVDFQQNKVLLPIVNVNAPATDINYQDKIVTVKSLGANPAYVRTHIAIPTALKDILVLDLNVGGTNSIWAQDTATTDITVGSIPYTVYSFTYSDDLATDEVTQVLLHGVYLKAEVDCQENPAVTDANGNAVRQYCTKDANGDWIFCDYDINAPVNVLVATQGCQAQGFTDAYDALDTVFDAIPNFG